MVQPAYQPEAQARVLHEAYPRLRFGLASDPLQWAKPKDQWIESE
jgi:hypothetical protein